MIACPPLDAFFSVTEAIRSEKRGSMRMTCAWVVDECVLTVRQ